MLLREKPLTPDSNSRQGAAARQGLYPFDPQVQEMCYFLSGQKTALGCRVVMQWRRDARRQSSTLKSASCEAVGLKDL
jgi:hypothetical protein